MITVSYQLTPKTSPISGAGYPTHPSTPPLSLPPQKPCIQMVLNLPIFTVIACMSMAVFMLMFNEDFNSSMFLYLTTPTIRTTTLDRRKPEEETREELFQCILPKYDSWDKDILYWFEPRIAEKNKCNKDFKMLSKLEKGKIVSTDKNYDCFGRCITRKTDFKNIVGDFKEINETFDCDIVEAQCYHVKSDKPSYAMLHTQVVPLPEKNISESKFPKYSVFVILVDSMATSQADRNIPKTMRYFEKSLEAVTFPYVNKVGINSRPNGMVLWFGKQIEEVDKTAFGEKPLKADIGWKESCNDYLDNYTSIFKDFNTEGYTTFLADDWAQGVLNWPNCYGFDEQPTDHLMQPFQLAVENKKNKLLYGNYTEENCIYQHRDALKYLNQFMAAYMDKPKFAWLWSSLQSHDYESSSVRLDTDLYEFMMFHKEQLDNSFVVLMGDHGLRFGKVTKTKVGALDVNNPLLSISIPKGLRNTDMPFIMRENAKKMQTHYDTRATLLDIAKYLPSTGSEDLAYINDENERGESLIRAQKLQDRSCKTLPIPFAYCLCEFKMQEISNTSAEAIEVGNAVINSVNHKLNRTNSSEVCNLWAFSNVTSIVGYYPVNETGAYTIVVGVKEPFVQAQFRAVVHHSKTGHFTVGGVDRVDSYGKRGYCVRGELAPLCDCKEQKAVKEEEEE